MEELTNYNITIGDWDAGVYAISLVDRPAIKSDFLHFKEEVVKQVFHLADEDKREVVGAILIPDKPIYRNIDGYEFNIVFTAEVIAQINERMQLTGGSKVFTIQHEMDARDTVQLLENWIKETDEDKSTALGIDEPIGSLFIKAKINSDLIWDNIKEGKLNGFSVEIDAGVVEAELNINNKNEKNMDFKSMYDSSTKVGELELLHNGELAKSSLIFNVVGEEDAKTLTPYTGEFKLDNVSYEVKDGLVTEVTDINLSIEEKIESMINSVNALKDALDNGKNEEGETSEEKLDAILTKMEETKLAMAQKSDDKATRDDKKEISTRLSVQDLDNVHSWLSKWN